MVFYDLKDLLFIIKIKLFWILRLFGNLDEDLWFIYKFFICILIIVDNKLLIILFILLLDV